jgi:hypothetical protein
MPTCVRQAWLVLPVSGTTIQLDNPTGGWFCQSLDLGTPIMRTVMNNAPDQDGVIDRTQYMGARTVIAAITVLKGAGARIDDVADSFAPFMVPSQRPVLHYVLDRGTNPERTLTLRPDSYDWPIVGAAQRDIALQWIAPNPIAYDPNQQSLTSTIAGGGAGNVTLNSPGDVPVRPQIQITGPVTGPYVVFANALNGTQLGSYTVRFGAGYVLAAGQVVTVDCAAHTAMQGATSVLNQINWPMNWPVCPIAPARSVISWNGSPAGAGSQVKILWNDGYLT